VKPIAKATGLALPKGSVFVFHCGGGGGYGPPSDRPREKVLEDLRRATSPRSTRAVTTRTRSTTPDAPLCGRRRWHVHRLVLLDERPVSS
jgi:hypothetical protein